MMKKEFLTPEIIILPPNAEDVMTASEGYDEIDNWKSDHFDLP